MLRTFCLLAFIMLALMPAVAQEEAAPSPFTPAEEAAIADIVRRTLLENPEILIQASEILQYRQQIEEQRLLAEKAMANRDRIETDRYAPIGGNPDGPITVVEFYDYQCGFCRRAYADVKALLEGQDQVRYVFKQFPVLDRPGDDPVSRTGAKYALAAEKQGLFLEFHDAVMTSEGRISIPRLDRIARRVGLDLDRLKADAEQPELETYLDANLALGRETGINGTPTYVINGLVVAGARGLEALEKTVAEAEAAMAE